MILSFPLTSLRALRGFVLSSYRLMCDTWVGLLRPYVQIPDGVLVYAQVFKSLLPSIWHVSAVEYHGEPAALGLLDPPARRTSVSRLIHELK